ncbi:hypothetical protein D3C73_1359970 [compost metagenome]
MMFSPGFSVFSKSLTGINLLAFIEIGLLVAADINAPKTRSAKPMCAIAEPANFAFPPNA